MENKILIVDNTQADRAALRAIFENDFDILEAASGKEALSVIDAQPGEIAVVLLDLIMDELSGFDVLEKRAELPEFRDIPVVVTTGSTEIADQAKAFELGANEYLTKPFDPVIVSSRVRNVLSLHQKMMEAKSEAENLKAISERDEMTGIFNKASTEKFMDGILGQSEGCLDVMLVIDIDKFKSINDSFGHQAGDLVIKAIAAMIAQNFRKTDIVGRIGGDEFCVLMIGVPTIDLARRKADRLLHSVKYNLGNPIPAFATISVGMAFNGRKSISYGELFARADEALYEAKKNGRAQYREYGLDPHSNEKAQAEGFKSPEEAVKAMLHFYMDEKNVEATMNCVTDDILWVGTEATDRASGKAQLKEILEASVRAFPHSFCVKIENAIRQILGQTLVQYQFDVRDENRVKDKNSNNHFSIRMSICCESTEDGWKVKSLHASTPSTVMQTFKLQKELDQNRKMEQTLLSGITGGAAIYRLKKDGRFETDYATDGVARLFGYDDPKAFMEYYQKDARVNIPEEDVDILEQAMRKSMTTGKHVYAIYHNHVKNGPDILQRIDADLVDTKLGEEDVAVWYAVHTKVTDETEQELKEQERYRLVLEMLHIAYWEWSKKDGYYISPRYYDYAISTADQNTVWTVDEYRKYVHPDDLQIMTNFINKDKSTQNTAKAIARCKLKDGSYQWTEMYSFNEYARDGSVSMIISAMRGVDDAWIEQKVQLEEALKAARGKAL